MITATYSPEDNKLRLYPSQRLDAETFERVKEAGYRWAPKQELFVAPKWTPRREDLALELAGEIEPEEMTLAERAAMKAERLDALADKRAAEANAFRNRAREIGQRFEFGQPILKGHHSERKALKDKERMDTADAKAVKASRAVTYWNYRAEGVEAYANMKNDPRTRARRIKTLLAELRDVQRTINDAHKARAQMEAATTPEEIKAVVGSGFVSWSYWSKVDSGEISTDDAKAQIIEAKTRVIEGPHYKRWIAHILNRLAYERELLGEVPRFTGEMRPTVIQMFVREHGADKPKAQHIEGEQWAIETKAPLPAHIGDGDYLEMSADQWRDLMQDCGYHPPAQKEAKPPILNFRADKIEFKGRGYNGQTETLEQIEMTKDEYKAQRDGAWVQGSACGQYRARTCTDPHDSRAYYLRRRVAVFLTDSKAHPAPAAQGELI